MKANYYFRLLFGPALGIAIMLFGNLDAQNPLVSRMAGITVWVAWWWMTEVVNLAVTSMLPFVLMPLLGVLDAKSTAFQYFDQIIFLFVGGFIISYAIEKWNLHQRLSLGILGRVGGNPSTILAGVMGTTFFVSMWMSNTATVMMFVSAVLAVNTQLKSLLSAPKQTDVSAALLLGLAYSATIGGMATLVGTPTNMIFYSFYTDKFPQAETVNFASWFGVAFPISMVMLLILYAVLRWWFIGDARHLVFDRSYFKNEYHKLGKMMYEEKIIATITVLTAVLWFTRQTLPIGNMQLFGWGRLFPKDFVQDSTVAVLMAMLLFLIPSRHHADKKILHWHDVQKLPFGIILLFGGGFALSKGFEVSGLSTYLASQLHFLSAVHPLIIILSVCAVVCIISEFASNVASIQLVLPILVAIQQSTGLSPLLLMIPATLAASLGFMLPVATAPNTIVYGTQLVPLKAMFRVGFLLDVLGVMAIGLLCYLLL